MLAQVMSPHSQLCGMSSSRHNTIKFGLDNSHVEAPAVGKASGLSKLDRWRSLLNGIKRLVGVTLSD